MNARSRFALLVALAGLGCQSDTIAGPNGTIVIEPIEIQSAEVTVGIARPALVTARVAGTLGSGCDYLHSIEQRREGAAVTIDVKRSRVTGVPCTTIHKGFDQELGLGAFEAGQYDLRVNGFRRTFAVP